MPGRKPAIVWLLAAVPLLLLGLLVGFLVWSDPADFLSGEETPPVERLRFQRVELRPEGIVATVLNDGPDPVTIAQVQVDEAYWNFSADPGTTLGHLGRATLTLPYPWVHGESHLLRIVTSTGLTFDHPIAVAVTTPHLGLRFLGIFTLIGLYVGVIPVAIGLLWFPFVRNLGAQGLGFLLALTIGLLLFLVVDASHEGLEAAVAVPGSYQGVALFAFAALAAYIGLEALGAWLLERRRRLDSRSAGGSAANALVLAFLIAMGIGLHNFSEGLAIGGAFVLGEAALGSLLIIGFTLHNTTEGLAIVAPLARQSPAARSRVSIRTLMGLGLIGGAPTIAGAWLGGSVYAAAWAVIFLGVGVGAIAQVIVQILRQSAGDEPIAQYLAKGTVLGGLLAGFLVMYSTGLLIG
ncbi:MAG: metal transporter [Acidobacteria bacterium]|nr:metal transporter [Acidobacteriota bacterium]